MNERISQIQTGLLAGILVVLVVIAIKPAGQTTAEANQYSYGNPLPVEITSARLNGSPLDVHVVSDVGYPLQVEVTNSCGNRGNPRLGIKGDDPCLVTVSP